MFKLGIGTAFGQTTGRVFRDRDNAVAKGGSVVWVFCSRVRNA